MPHRAANGRLADVTNPAHWSTFLTAVSGMRHRGHDGLSFVLTADDPYCGIDLDDCRDPRGGAVEDWAQRIVQRFKSYTEITPSETGLRIWIRGVLPVGGNRKGHVEIYDRSKALTVTGNHLDGTPETIEDLQDVLSVFCSELFPRPVVRPLPITASPSEYRLTDAEVLRVATRARNGAKLSRLLRGDHSYRSDSEADMALVGILASYTQDAEQLERLWQGSGLARNKTHRPGYVGRTITQATKNRRFTYDPNYSSRVTS